MLQILLISLACHADIPPGGELLTKPPAHPVLSNCARVMSVFPRAVSNGFHCYCSLRFELCKNSCRFVVMTARLYNRLHGYVMS